LANGVGRALVPLRTFGCLLCGQNVDEAAGKIIEFIARLNVAMQRHAVELGQNINRTQSRVKAVADRDINQAILAAEGNGWFCSVFCQREEPRSRPAAHDNGERSLRRTGRKRRRLHLANVIANRNRRSRDFPPPKIDLRPIPWRSGARHDSCTANVVM
jgi:hypothetical protein